MYIHSLTIRNFRIFEEETIVFQPHFNLLIGPNDSGKSAVIDALRIALTTRTLERVTIDDAFDFRRPDRDIEIDLEIRFEQSSESSAFGEWLTLRSLPEPDDSVLNLYCRTARSPRGDYYYLRRKAGPNFALATEMDAGALERLQAVYLKPIRDAKLDLSPSSGSRLSKILFAHNSIRGRAKEIIEDFNEGMSAINVRFDEDGDLHGVTTGTINAYFGKFSMAAQAPTAQMGLFGDGSSEDAQLRAILQKFHLKTKDHPGLLGLGTTNTLYMASELMLIEDAPANNLRVALVEEIEAHIHPMRELKIMKELQSECTEKCVQVIASSHSPNLASKLKIENLLLCQDGKVLDFRKGSTKLKPEDYKYLERFLDVTKSNMFFSRGIIFVEGPTEQFLVPAFAQVLEYDLTDYGVTVVVLNHLSFDRFSRAFRRTDNRKSAVPVALVKDADDKRSADAKSASTNETYAESRIGTFYGLAFDEAPLIGTGQDTSTVERIVLSSTGPLQSIYLTAAPWLNGTAAEQYEQIKKSKAPVAQEASLIIDEILFMEATAKGRRLPGITPAALKDDIKKLFPNIHEAIKHACGVSDDATGDSDMPVQPVLDL